MHDRNACGRIPSVTIGSPRMRLVAFGFNVAQSYARLARDMKVGTHTCPSFGDALVRHEILAAGSTAASSGCRQYLI
jgi:hypothetical protein